MGCVPNSADREPVKQEQFLRFIPATTWRGAKGARERVLLNYFSHGPFGLRCLSLSASSQQRDFHNEDRYADCVARDMACQVWVEPANGGKADRDEVAFCKASCGRHELSQSRGNTSEKGALMADDWTR